MSRPRSLRSLLLIGLVVLNLAVIVGFSTTVYARARSETHQAMRDDLALRARTMAGLLEIDPDARDGLEFELPQRAMPEYLEPGSGAYGVIYDHTGKARRTSASMGEYAMAAQGPWTEDGFVFTELEAGPDGFPCAVVTHSFLVRLEIEDDDLDDMPPGWAMPTEAERRYQVVVATDSRPRDQSVASLGMFLALVGLVALGVTTLGGLLVARFVLRPIERMTAEAESLSPDDPSRRLQPESVVRELHSLSLTLNSALDRLGDALDRQRRFASDASHELRTPLAVLLGNADLLLRRKRSADEYRTGLKRQIRVAKRMTDITENLLALARADDGRTQLQRTRVELSEVARVVCDELEPMAEEAGVELVCETNGAVELDGDATYLAGLIQNLVANALKFTPEGGTVRMRVARNGTAAMVDVSDTGPGIAEEHQQHVFDRFYRVNEGKDQREGAGLGLSIVHWIVRAHGGRIDVKSEVGQGTTFAVRLPLADHCSSDEKTLDRAVG